MEAVEVNLKAIPFDLDFHPTQDLVATGLINGRVHLYRYEDTSSGPQLLWSARPHRESCRGIRFANEGQLVLSVSPDCCIQAANVETGQLVARLVDAHESAINRIVNLGGTTIATGDDQGVIKVWDTRQNSCCGMISSHEDLVNDMEFVSEGMQLLSVGGDGKLVLNNLRRFTVDVSSEFSEDELLSVVRAKNGRKVVCGSQDGVLLLYTWGEFQDCNDRFLGHPNSVDALLKWDEDTLVTGSSDGIIRVVTILPNKMIGVVGEHSVYPLERLAFSRDKAWLGSLSHDNTMKLWDMRELPNDLHQSSRAGTSAAAAADADSSDDEDEQMQERQQQLLQQPQQSKNASFFADLL